MPWGARVNIWNTAGAATSLQAARQIRHADTLDQTPNDHHQRDHSDRHLDAGADELVKVVLLEVDLDGLESLDVVATWTVPFLDAEYSVQAVAEHDDDIGIRVLRVRERSPATVRLRVVNDSAGVRSGFVHVWGIRHPMLES